MASNASIILSGFADEAANEKTTDQQFAAFAALGLRYLSIRFIDAGGGIKNVMDLDRSEISIVKASLDEYGLSVSSIGSPIGKVKLVDVNDGTDNLYYPFEKYLDTEVRRACELANAFDSKLIRGFSFYHPKGDDPLNHVAQAVDQLGRIAEECQQHGSTLGLELEANLVGQTGDILADMHNQIANPALVLIFDGANLVTQGFSADEIFVQYQRMKPGLGWIHIKDFRNPQDVVRTQYVDEQRLKNFVPADIGDAGHVRILDDLKDFLPTLNERMKRRDVAGVFADLEPHVKGGGQFGGFSGPDGFGVALRAFCRMCDSAGIEYRLRDFDDIRHDRGF